MRSALPHLATENVLAPHLTSPTTIFNLIQVVNQLVVTVNGIATKQDTILASQKSVASTVASLTLAVGQISLQLQAFAADQIATLNSDVVNIQELLQAIITGLGGLATETDIQNIESNLETILISILPPTVGLDLSNVAHTSQPIPSKPGP